MKRIAVIGSGISGLGAAWALKDRADVTLYERRDRLGGHAHTVEVDHDGTVIPVDWGFIVYNTHNYHHLTSFFGELGVATIESDMSFSVSAPDGFEWASTLWGLFARRRNLVRPRFHRFWRTILRFNDIARTELASGAIVDTTLRAWLDRHGFDADFRENYLLPMGAAIWSTPEDDMLEYPALSFFRFFDNHRLMHAERPKWRTVSGGSRHYVEAVGRDLGERVRSGRPVRRVVPFASKVAVECESGDRNLYDHVILACHSDQAHAILDPAFESQRFLLGSVRYRPNRIVLHRDPALMPRLRAAWASWNVIKGEGRELCLTYWMNRLQGIDPKCPVFVTLNPPSEPDPALTFAETSFDHPQFDAAALAATRGLRRIQGRDGLLFAGAWLGSGFHEDGLKSGLEAALALGGQVPWTTDNLDIPELADLAPTPASSIEIAR